MTRKTNISRREALRRLGLGIATAYVAPSFTTLSTAHASGTTATPATAPTLATSPTPATAPTPVTAPTVVSVPSTATNENSEDSPNSRSGTCSVPSVSEVLNISRADYRRAQRAVENGSARTLSEIMSEIGNDLPGKIVEVGFTNRSSGSVYRLLVVSPHGAVVTATVDASSAQILSLVGC